MLQHHYLVPTQLDGQEKDIAHTIHTKTIEDAEDWFVDAKERMLDVNNWKKFSGIKDVEFKLTDSNGRIVVRRARKGDHIRIDVGGKGYEQAGSFGWVAIEAIEYDDYPDVGTETFALRVRPTTNPVATGGNRAGEQGHLATSTLVIDRTGKLLSAHYHARNEGDYYSAEPHVYGRPADVAALLCLSDAQCESLVKGLII